MIHMKKVQDHQKSILILQSCLSAISFTSCAVRQGQSQGQEQLNVVCVVDALLKMSLPVSMAGNKGFRPWLAMFNPKIQFKHKTFVCSLMKHILGASSELLKDEIKATFLGAFSGVSSARTWSA
jgi:hypothetical protein